jgi:hypothetical protein
MWGLVIVLVPWPSTVINGKVILNVFRSAAVAWEPQSMTAAPTGSGRVTAFACRSVRQ